MTGIAIRPDYFDYAKILANLQNYRIDDGFRMNSLSVMKPG